MQLKIPLLILLIITALFSITIFGHNIFVQDYFHGPPPTDDFERGQTVLNVTIVIALTTTIFSMFVTAFDLKSINIIILINTGFVVTLICCAFVMYYFRDPDPPIEKFQTYTKNYFKKHGKPPPFFNKLQLEVNGYCCGAGSYLDYVDHDRDFFDIPYSCCFKRLRKSDAHCGKNKWKYLYMFLNSKLTLILKTLETQYSNTDDLQEVLLSVARKESREFIDKHLHTMFQDRVKSIKSSISSSKYEEIRRQENAKHPNMDSAELAKHITGRISNVASQQLRELQQEITDAVSISFVPMGCWALMEELKVSNWKGFKRFQVVRSRVVSTFQGILGMVIVNFLLLVICDVFFNIQQIMAKEVSVKTTEDGERLLSQESTTSGENINLKRRSNASSDGSANPVFEDTEDEEFHTLIISSQKASISKVQIQSNQSLNAIHN